MAKRKKVNGTLNEKSIMSEARNELYCLQDSCRGLEKAHGDLESMLDSVTASVDALGNTVKALDETMQKCLRFMEAHAERMDDWSDRLAAMEDAIEEL